MTQIMTATEMTDGQIENAVNKLRDAMRKHRHEITSDVAQQVLGVENLGMMMFTPFRERAEAVSNLIVRKVKVHRGRSQQEAIEATGCVRYTDRKVVDEMPQGDGEEVEVVFFRPEPWEYTRPGYMSDDDLEKCFDRHNAKPADPISVAAVNAADLSFSDSHPNGTHWKDAKGNWCYIAFDRWDDGRGVGVGRHDYDWVGDWWFAGRRK